MDRTEAEQGAEAAGGGGGGEAPGGGELGEGLQDPGQDGGQREIAVAAALTVQGAFQTKLAGQAEEDGDMAV